MKKFITWSSLSDNLVKVATIASGFATTIGALLALYQYTQSLQEERVAQVSAYAEKYNSGGYLEARERIEAVWLEEYTQIANTANAGYNQWSEFTEKVISDNRISHDIDLLIEFYSIVYTCVISEVCDLNTARTVFMHDLSDFVAIHFAYLCKRSITQYSTAKAKRLEDLIQLHLLLNDADIPYSTYFERECGKTDSVEE